jgi:hypothetical protein
MKFYQKEIPETAVVILGNSMRFDILETADPILIVELDKCIARGVGGVISISEAQFQEELKKKKEGLLSPDSLNRPRMRQELSANHLLNLRAAGAGGNFGNANGQFAQPQVGRAHTPNNSFGLPRAQGPAPEPIEVPTAESFAASFTKPPTARMSEVKATA